MAEASASSSKRNAEEMDTESGGIDQEIKRPCFPEVTAQKLVSNFVKADLRDRCVYQTGVVFERVQLKVDIATREDTGLGLGNHPK